MFFPEWVHRLFRIPYTLHVRTYGKRGPKLIFLHGIASQGSSWNPLIKHLSRDYRCVVIDLLGHGASPKPNHIQYDIDTHCRSLRWTLFLRGLDKRAVFVGHSMGALIATHYAARYKWRVRGLVLISMPIYLKRNMLEKPRLLEGFLDNSYLSVYRAMRKLNVEQAVRAAKVIIKTAPWLAGQLTLTQDTWYPFVSSLAYTIEEQSVAKDLKRIPTSTPITVLYGTLDNLVISANLRQAFRKRKNTKLQRMLARHELAAESSLIITKAIHEMIPPR